MDFITEGAVLLSGSVTTDAINVAGGSAYKTYLMIIGAVIVISLGIYVLKRSGKFAVSAGKSALR